MLINFHYSSLVTASVAVIWSCEVVARLVKIPASGRERDGRTIGRGSVGELIARESCSVPLEKKDREKDI